MQTLTHAQYETLTEGTNRIATADRLTATMDKVTDAVFNRRGLSIHAFLGVKPPTRGFMVAARPDAELIVDPSDMENELGRVEDWVREHWSDARRHGLYFGVWIMDDGRACLDLAEHWWTESDALRVGRHRDQKAIWDLAAGASIAC
jgi:hypothetical protein